MHISVPKSLPLLEFLFVQTGAVTLVIPVWELKGWPICIPVAGIRRVSCISLSSSQLEGMTWGQAGTVPALPLPIAQHDAWLASAAWSCWGKEE